MEQELIQQPIIQYGFAGFSGVLLGIVVWLITKVLYVVDKNTKAMVRHAEVTAEMRGVLKEVKNSINHHSETAADLKLELVQRPCLKGAGSAS